MATDVVSHIAGTVWKLERKAGDAVEAGETVVILESMKMEVPIEAPIGGTIRSLSVAEGDPVAEDAVVAVIE